MANTKFDVGDKVVKKGEIEDEVYEIGSISISRHEVKYYHKDITNNKPGLPFVNSSEWELYTPPKQAELVLAISALCPHCEHSKYMPYKSFKVDHECEACHGIFEIDSMIWMEHLDSSEPTASKFPSREEVHTLMDIKNISLTGNNTKLLDFIYGEPKNGK